MAETEHSEASGSAPAVGAPGVSLADLIDQVPAIVYVDVPDAGASIGHRTVFLSRGVETLVGYVPGEILDDPNQWLGIVHPDDRDALIARTTRHLAEPSTLSSEYRLVHRDGHVLTVRDDCTSSADPATGRISSRGVITDVTALRRSETNFQQFLERLPIVAYTESPVDEEPFLYIGPQVEALTGFRPEDFFADDRLFERLVHPDDRALQLAGYGVPGEPYVADYRLIHRDGRTVWVRDRAVVELDAAGAVVAIHGFLLDITAEHEATAALDATEASYRRFVEGLPITPYTENEDLEGPFVYIGPQVEGLTGYSDAAFYADEDLYPRLVHPDDLQKMLEGYGDPTGRYSVDYRLRHRDGHEIWIHDEAVVVRDEGHPGQIRGFFIDVTAEREAAAALVAAEERYRTMIEQLPLVTYVDTLDKREQGHYPTAYISPQVERLLGVHQAAFTADPLLWRRMVHDDDVKRAFGQYVPNKDGEVVLEYRMLHANGDTIWVRDGSRVVRDAAGGQPVVKGYVLDITAMKRAEEALVRTQKLESLGNLAGGIAHDFNNLLVSILGNAELALLDLPPGADARSSIEQVELAARRAADLARQMLAYSGRGNFVVQPVSVNDMVREIVDLLRVAIGKGVGLSLRLADDLPPVEGDATQLRQVVMNIVVNASDAIGTSHGSISVATSQTVLDDAAAAALNAAGVVAPGEYVTIDIADTGTGMDEATMGRVFDPFFTTKFAGRGLGLAAVIGIVSGHRGGIAVTSTPGRGSRFTIYLPPGGRPVPAVSPDPPALTEMHGTILIADDEPSVRAVARRMLERLGWTVEEVENGAQAVDRVASGSTPVNAVLLDLTMPVLDGEGAFLRIHELRPGLPVVLMSGYTETDAIQRFGDAGLAGFVQKPFSQGDLSSALHEALARKAASETP